MTGCWDNEVEPNDLAITDPGNCPKSMNTSVAEIVGDSEVKKETDAGHKTEYLGRPDPNNKDRLDSIDISWDCDLAAVVETRYNSGPDPMTHELPITAKLAEAIVGLPEELAKQAIKNCFKNFSKKSIDEKYFFRGWADDDRKTGARGVTVRCWYKKPKSEAGIKKSDDGSKVTINKDALKQFFSRVNLRVEFRRWLID